MTSDEIIKALIDAVGSNELDFDVCELRPVLACAADLIKLLQFKLAKSQRREQAAVNDLILHGGCPSCKFKEYCEAHDMKKLKLDVTTHRFARCVNYEWRGEKGVAK